MRRAEIHQNFDAIVAFAEVEAFLDTPVKRYSSGMYLRLAFAVAAHLTPEILIVDEVLAVGDFEFQRKCLGRMNAVARSGRTVLFVSHNMVAVEELCDRVVLLRRGVIERVGPSREVIGRYLSSRSDGLLSAPGDLREREGSGRVRIAGIEILSADGGRRLESLQFNESFRIRLRYVVSEAIRDARFGVFVLTEQGERVFLVDTAETGPTGLAIAEKGQIDCLIRSPRLVPGRYGIEAYITDPMHPENLADRAYFCLMIAVEAAGLPCQRLSLLALSNRGAILADAVWLTPVPGEIPLRAYATTDSESPSGIEDLS
jgi:lipopolysaccharide transport system ATP-binding protein